MSIPHNLQFRHDARIIEAPTANDDEKNSAKRHQTTVIHSSNLICLNVSNWISNQRYFVVVFEIRTPSETMIVHSPIVCSWHVYLLYLYFDLSIMKFFFCGSQTRLWWLCVRNKNSPAPTRIVARCLKIVMRYLMAMINA